MRPLLDREQELVSYLFELAGYCLDAESLRVVPMEDGGMGSLAVAPLGRNGGFAASKCHFHDSDGTLASAVLYFDAEGEPVEVDIWKVDFLALVAWPTRAALRPGPPNDSFKPTPHRGAD